MVKKVYYAFFLSILLSSVSLQADPPLAVGHNKRNACEDLPERYLELWNHCINSGKDKNYCRGWVGCEGTLSNGEEVGENVR